MGRRKKLSLVMFMVTGFVIGMGAAQGQAALNSDHHFEVGPEIYYVNYEEPDVMEEKGFLFGIYGDYLYRRDDPATIDSWKTFVDNLDGNTIFGVDGRFAYGQVDYESVSTGTIDNINDFAVELRTTAGYDFPVLDDTLLTPYAGFGYRYLVDDTGGQTSTTGHSGYKRESYYLYIPLGIDTVTGINERWSIGFNFEYDIFIEGQQKSHLEDVSSLLNTLENDQNDGYGLRGGVKLLRQGDEFDISIEGFARFWDIDDSTIEVITCGGTPCAAGYEPKNNTIETGVRVGLLF